MNIYIDIITCDWVVEEEVAFELNGNAHIDRCVRWQKKNVRTKAVY